MRIFLQVLMIGCIASLGWGSPCLAQRGSLLIDDFDGPRNRLDGLRNTFQRIPCTAVAARVPNARLGYAGLGLQLTTHRQDEGYCGYWIHFLNTRSGQHRYVDATRFKCLCFWVKGATGGEQFTIKLADDMWIAKEDSVAIGPVEKYLDGGVTRRWQKVCIPLDEKLGINLRRLGGLTLDVQSPGQCTLMIDQITLETSEPPATKRRVDDVATNFGRSLWLWKTEALLDDPSRSNDFIRFCTSQGVKQVWAQLPHRMRVQRSGNRVTGSACVIERDSALRRFLSDAHAAGLTVHALEGYPEYAQRHHHHVPLAIVDAVLAFNKGQPAAERFDGVHFDNEPYLLVGWHDPERREQILYEFLSLSKECQRRVEAASPRIKFGVDVPFWFHDASQTAVTFDGRRGSVGSHLVGMLNNIGIMNYRDSAVGADGIIASARGFIAEAESAATAEVFVGLETCPRAASEVLFAVGIRRDEFHQAVHGCGAEIARLSRIDGSRLRVVDDGDRIHVGIEIAEVGTLPGKIKIAKTLSKIAAAFGVAADEPLENASRYQEHLTQHLVDNNRWFDVKPCSVRDPESGRTHLLVKASTIASEKTTFAEETAKQFSAQILLAEEHFSRHRCFHGLAIHDYQSFRDLVTPAEDAPEGKVQEGKVDVTPVAEATTLTSAK